MLELAHGFKAWLPAFLMLLPPKASAVLGSIFLALLALVIIAKTSRDIAFYLDKNVVAVHAPADVQKLRDNVTAEIYLPLDSAKAYGVSYLSEREFILIPFAEVGYRLMYVLEGPLSEKSIATLTSPYKGRVVAKDFGDSWDVFGKSMKLEKIFARDRMPLPENALLVYDAPREPPGLWTCFLLALSIVYLAFLAIALLRRFRRRKESAL